jgi:glyoxylase-like metal-dependent hydrolase (beta-lactamase superfamily II)
MPGIFPSPSTTVFVVGGEGEGEGGSSSKNMFLEKIIVGPFQCNCSILACEKTQEALVIDPGGEGGKIVQLLKEKGWKPKYLLHTHAHLDHVGATDPVHRQLGGEVCLHREDLFLYDHVDMQAALFQLPTFPVPAVHHYFKDQETLKFGNYRIEVLHTPGHTPGSTSFCIPSEEQGVAPLLFTGDTLFYGSIGRTDLWGGDFNLILQSIHHKLLPFQDNAVVVPGHGPETTIGFERKENPFLV